MSGSGNNGAPGGVNASGSIVSGAPGRQLTAVQKIGVAGLVLVVFLSFIWISHLTKATQEVKPQTDLAAWTGGAFRPAAAAVDRLPPLRPARCPCRRRRRRPRCSRRRGSTR